MKSLVWRLCGLDTLGADLALQQLVGWAAAGDVVPTSIQASVAPVSGSLNELSSGATAEVVFSGAAVRQPGFYIELGFASAVELFDFRFRGPDATRWPCAYMLTAAGADSIYRGGPIWVAGALSAGGSTPPDVEKISADLTSLTAGPSGGIYGAGVSAYGGVVACAPHAQSPYLSKDFGVTWSRPSGAPGLQYSRAAVSDDGGVILFSNYGGPLYLSTNAGASFTAVDGAGSRGWESCAVSGDGSTLLAADGTAGGGLWRSTDGGATWAICAGAGAKAWLGVSVSALGDIVLATAANSSPSISFDGGATWADVAGVPSAPLTRCAVSRNGTALAVCARAGWIYASWDGGLSWSRDTLAASSEWRNIALSGDGQFYIAGTGNNARVLYARNKNGSVKSFTFVALAMEAAAVDAYGVAWTASAESGFLARVRIWAPAATHAPLVSRIRSHKLSTSPSEAVPLQQGMQSMVRYRPSKLIDVECGGQGRIYGTVSRKETPANVPLRRRVRLHRSVDGYLARETWSNADGSYEFREISARYEWDVIAWDHELQEYSTVANNQLAEVA